MPKYVCSNNPQHQFDAMTADAFCTEPDCFGIGFLSESDPNTLLATPVLDREVGLCVLLMDVSASMTLPALDNAPAAKEIFVARNASAAIFDLKGMTKPEDAYIVIVTFDDNVKTILCDSIANILRNFETKEKFADFLMGHFTHGNTDINKALSYTKEIYDSFIKQGDLSAYGGPKNLKPVYHNVLDKKNNAIIVPNIRVFIYSDGEDVVTGKIHGNPFASENTDVLIAAYFGQGNEQGCTDIKNITSKCPIHAVDQFFLINDSHRLQTLRGLFRMASGTSGFCPTCLVNEIKEKGR